jgi:phospholipid transport system transporter-binding protein
MQLDVDHIDNRNATELLARGRAALQAGDRTIDLSAVRHCDSAAVAMLLALRRIALSGGGDLTLVGVPASLCNLADLYGVDGLLPGVNATQAQRVDVHAITRAGVDATTGS